MLTINTSSRAPAASLAAAAFSLCFGAAAPADEYDAGAQFSIVNGNPNGVWTYGYRADLLSSGLVVFPSAATDPNGLQAWFDPAYNPLGTPAFAYNGTGSDIHAVGMTWPPGRLSYHPSPLHYTVLRWTAPRAGNWRVHALFLGMDIGTTDCIVLQNGAATLASGSRSGIGGNAGPYEPEVQLSAGDTVEFVVGNAGNFFYDTTGLEARMRLDCPADWNGVDGLDSQDFFDFLDALFAGDADFNGYDGTDSQDYFDFLEAFFAGCS